MILNTEEAEKFYQCHKKIYILYVAVSVMNLSLIRFFSLNIGLSFYFASTISSNGRNCFPTETPAYQTVVCMHFSLTSLS